MIARLQITPHGQLRWEENPADLYQLSAGEPPRELKAAFERSAFDGLLYMACEELPAGLPAEFGFWQALAKQVFKAVCQLGEEGERRWRELAPPDIAGLDEIVAAAPPMHGLEYLTVEVLRQHWCLLRDGLADRAAKHAGGAAAYLQTLNPVWRLLGRVTFHLAENKRDPQRPFAFLATFTHKMAGKAKVAHLPLAEALKQYVGARDREKLQVLLSPIERAAEKSELAKELLASKAIFAPQAWDIRQAYRFLQQTPLMEDAGVVVRVPDWWSARRPLRPQVQVKIGSKTPSQLGMDGLLDFRAAVSLDGEELTDKERKELLASTDGLALLRGKWVEIDRQQLKQALDHWKLLERETPEGVSFIDGMRMLAGVPLQTGDAADDAQSSGWTRITSGPWLQEILAQMRSPTADKQCQPGRDLQATLRPYQVEGVRWLWFMTRLGLGACLADDMGLGKTIQLIDLLQQRKRIFAKDSLPLDPALLVAPASLLGNWRQELQKFAPGLRVCILHRSECDPDTLAKIARNPQQQTSEYDLVLTTYGLVRRQEWLMKRKWSLVVLDEAQAIKNAGSTQAKAVKKLPAGGRIVLTGTPVENELGDLWSIFDFCCPGLLGSAGDFKKYVKRLSDRKDAHAYGALRQLVRPYILRRMKTDPNIVPDLPAKTEMRAECGLTRKQAAMYEQAVEGLAVRLKEAEGIARRGLVLSALMQLKQICNHPAQYARGAAFAPQDSGKFERLQMLCEPIHERQEKVLVFTQFQSIIEPLADFLQSVFGSPGLILHGGTPVAKRSKLVKEFQTDGGPSFFVISLKAGGSGLNLTAASHVIHFDRWWNPAVENQATDRAFRIGQKRNVLVHKFVCRGTLEEKIDAMIQDKQSLADQLLGQEGETLLTEMKDDELLRFVALDISRATED